MVDCIDLIPAHSHDVRQLNIPPGLHIIILLLANMEVGIILVVGLLMRHGCNKTTFILCLYGC